VTASGHLQQGPRHNSLLNVVLHDNPRLRTEADD